MQIARSCSFHSVPRMLSSIGMLGRSFALDGAGAGVVFDEHDLDGVEVVLADGAEAAAVVVPVAAKTLVDAVWMVGFTGGAAKREVVVEVIGDLGVFEVGATAPLIEFAVDTGGGGKISTHEPAEEAAGDGFAEIANAEAGAVKAGAVVEVIPGVDAKDAAGVLTARTRAWPSMTVREMGFSHRTSLPALAVAMAMRACQWGGVEIAMMSMPR